MTWLTENHQGVTPPHVCRSRHAPRGLKAKLAAGVLPLQERMEAKSASADQEGQGEEAVIPTSSRHGDFNHLIRQYNQPGKSLIG
jgi:hypothetical protein